MESLWICSLESSYRYVRASTVGGGMVGDLRPQLNSNIFVTRRGIEFLRRH